MGYFPGGPQLFKQFHQREDHREFLDMRDDVEHNRIRAAQAVIEAFCNVRGITDSQEIHTRGAYLEDLVAELLQDTRLSHRHIAKLLMISNSAVHKVSLRHK